MSSRVRGAKLATASVPRLAVANKGATGWVLRGDCHPHRVPPMSCHPCDTPPPHYWVLACSVMSGTCPGSRVKTSSNTQFKGKLEAWAGLSAAADAWKAAFPNSLLSRSQLAPSLLLQPMTRSPSPLPQSSRPFQFPISQKEKPSAKDTQPHPWVPPPLDFLSPSKSVLIFKYPSVCVFLNQHPSSEIEKPCFHFVNRAIQCRTHILFYIKL